jgi:hypothetical protein
MLQIRHAAVAGADLSALKHTFVKLSSGTLVAAGDGERGFILVDAPASGEVGSIVLTGKEKVLVGTGGVTEMAPVASDANGAAVATASTDVINGVALETVAAGGYAMILVAQAGGIVV